uniref:Uncharacterized protein n=1 Tax=Glossina morsitans morsitans TaxID=37546 RepID=A0A1B0FEW1_GLOMM
MIYGRVVKVFTSGRCKFYKVKHGQSNLVHLLVFDFLVYLILCGIFLRRCLYHSLHLGYMFPRHVGLHRYFTAVHTISTLLR